MTPSRQRRPKHQAKHDGDRDCQHPTEATYGYGSGRTPIIERLPRCHNHRDVRRREAAQLEREVETELNRTRDHWRYRVEAGRIRFERDVRRAHKRLKQSIPKFINAIEKLNCVYCGYANGVIAYVREIAGRTEQYWCPIRHATRVRAPHAHYREFVDYGDAKGYHRQLPVLRDELKGKKSVGDT